MSGFLGAFIAMGSLGLVIVACAAFIDWANRR